MEYLYNSEQRGAQFVERANHFCGMNTSGPEFLDRRQNCCMMFSRIPEFLEFTQKRCLLKTTVSIFCWRQYGTSVGSITTRCTVR